MTSLIINGLRNVQWSSKGFSFKILVSKRLIKQPVTRALDKCLSFIFSKANKKKEKKNSFHTCAEMYVVKYNFSNSVFSKTRASNGSNYFILSLFLISSSDTSLYTLFERLLYIFSVKYSGEKKWWAGYSIIGSRSTRTDKTV